MFARSGAQTSGVTSRWLPTTAMTQELSFDEESRAILQRLVEEKRSALDGAHDAPAISAWKAMAAGPTAFEQDELEAAAAQHGAPAAYESFDDHDPPPPPPAPQGDRSDADGTPGSRRSSESGRAHV